MAQAVAKFTGGYDMRNTKFWNDMETKGTRLRLNWFEKNFEKIFAQVSKDQVPSLALELIKELRKGKEKEADSAPRESFAVKRVPFPPVPKADPSVALQTMKPMDPEIREILYDGISANGEGRELYLHERYKLDPNQRYFFPETTSFDYGWHGTELAAILNNGPRYGKSQVIKHSFYSRNGIHPDDPRERLPFGPTIVEAPL